MPPCSNVSVLPPTKVSYEPDGVTETVVKAMPSAVAASDRAVGLGLRADAGAREIVDEYVKGGWLGQPQGPSCA